MQCRANCGACCTAISISSAIPGMPKGKPAGTTCIHLADDKRCKLFGKPERPNICSSFQANPDTCGGSAQEAFSLIAELERLTSPTHTRPGASSDKKA